MVPCAERLLLSVDPCAEWLACQRQGKPHAGWRITQEHREISRLAGFGASREPVPVGRRRPRGDDAVTVLKGAQGERILLEGADGDVSVRCRSA
jgi:hypothetical protein